MPWGQPCVRGETASKDGCTPNVNPRAPFDADRRGSSGGAASSPAPLQGGRSAMHEGARYGRSLHKIPLKTPTAAAPSLAPRPPLPAAPPQPPPSTQTTAGRSLVTLYRAAYAELEGLDGSDRAGLALVLAASRLPSNAAYSDPKARLALVQSVLEGLKPAAPEGGVQLGTQADRTDPSAGGPSGTPGSERGADDCDGGAGVWRPAGGSGKAVCVHNAGSAKGPSGKAKGVVANERGEMHVKGKKIGQIPDSKPGSGPGRKILSKSLGGEKHTFRKEGGQPPGAERRGAAPPATAPRPGSSERGDRPPGEDIAQQRQQGQGGQQPRAAGAGPTVAAAPTPAPAAEGVQLAPERRGASPDRRPAGTPGTGAFDRRTAAAELGLHPEQHKAALDRMEQMHHEAQQDPLGSGALNKRAFLQHMESKKGQPGRYFAVDASGLKKVNDLLSHGAGDAMLKSIVGAMGRFGMVGRMGGDEFAAFGDGMTSEQAHAAATRLEQHFRDNPITVQVGGKTYQIDVAAHIGTGDTYEAADAASNAHRIQHGSGRDATKLPFREIGGGEPAAGVHAGEVRGEPPAGSAAGDPGSESGGAPDRPDAGRQAPAVTPRQTGDRRQGPTEPVPEGERELRSGEERREGPPTAALPTAAPPTAPRPAPRPAPGGERRTETRTEPQAELFPPASPAAESARGLPPQEGEADPDDDEPETGAVPGGSPIEAGMAKAGGPAGPPALTPPGRQLKGPARRERMTEGPPSTKPIKGMRSKDLSPAAQQALAEDEPTPSAADEAAEDMRQSALAPPPAGSTADDPARDQRERIPAVTPRKKAVDAAKVATGAAKGDVQEALSHLEKTGALEQTGSGTADTAKHVAEAMGVPAAPARLGPNATPEEKAAHKEAWERRRVAQEARLGTAPRTGFEPQEKMGGHDQYGMPVENPLPGVRPRPGFEPHFATGGAPPQSTTEIGMKRQGPQRTGDRRAPGRQAADFDRYDKAGDVGKALDAGGRRRRDQGPDARADDIKFQPSSARDTPAAQAKRDADQAEFGKRLMERVGPAAEGEDVDENDPRWSRSAREIPKVTPEQAAAKTGAMSVAPRSKTVADELDDEDEPLEFQPRKTGGDTLARRAEKADAERKARRAERNRQRADIGKQDTDSSLNRTNIRPRRK